MQSQTPSSASPSAIPRQDPFAQLLIIIKASLQKEPTPQVHAVSDSQPIPSNTFFPMRLHAIQRAHSRPALHAPHTSPIPAHLAERPRRVVVLPLAPGLVVCKRRVSEQLPQFCVRWHRRHARYQQRVVVAGMSSRWWPVRADQDGRQIRIRHRRILVLRRHRGSS